jgi:hypothetical protein
VEKEIKGIGDQFSNLKAFMMHNSTNFVVAVRPRLKAAFPSKYRWNATVTERFAIA